VVARVLATLRRLELWKEIQIFFTVSIESQGRELVNYSFCVYDKFPQWKLFFPYLFCVIFFIVAYALREQF